MNQNLLKKISLFTYLCIISFMAPVSFASDNQTTEPKQTLAQYFEEEVLLTDKALQVESTPITMIGDRRSDDDAYFFRRFWLRLRPRVERDIPWLAGFSVIPDLEMLFEKPAPEGWDMYKIEKKRN